MLQRIVNSNFIIKLQLVNKKKSLHNISIIRSIHNIIKQSYDHSKCKYYQFIDCNKDKVNEKKLVIKEKLIDTSIDSRHTNSIIHSYINELWYYILPKGYPIR